MGITSQTERGERREMVILLILLVSTAFGRPSSDRDVGTQIGNQLEDILEFNNEQGKLLNNSNLFGKVSESLKNAQQNIIDMETELKTLALKFESLREEKSFFPEFNNAKSSLRQTRQELRELAHRTVKEEKNVRSLLDALDNDATSPSHKPILLKAAIGRMKLLMEETKEKLKAAKNKYEEATLAYTNLISSVKAQHDILGVEARKIYEKFNEDKEYTEKVRSDCKIASWFTFGLCSLIHHFVNEVPLEEARVEVEKLETMSEKLTERAKILNKDINEAIEIMDDEIELIDKWANSAEKMEKNIDDFPEESLREFEAYRLVFKLGLDDLKKAAENFLAQPMP